MQHGIVARITDPKCAYFGWPSVAVTQSGRIAVVASGLRRQHIDPWGKTVLCISDDGGETFTPPRVIRDSSLDDRDAGILSLGGEKLLATCFSITVDPYEDYMRNALSAEDFAEAQAVMANYTPEMLQKDRGSWIMLSDDGGETWQNAFRCLPNTPHGPVRLADGRLFYLGRGFDPNELHITGRIYMHESLDNGHTWTQLGAVPDAPDADYTIMHEPHVAVWEDGRAVALIRIAHPGPAECTYATYSADFGRTWTVPVPTEIRGFPAHLCRHSSGALIAVYGWRGARPCGQRLRISHDRGATWGPEYILDDRGPTADLGYPCTAELPDGSLFTVYYQAPEGDPVPALLYTKWTLKELDDNGI